ncbi:MAG: elongation factor G [Candidatus Hydrogenedentota bacterium]
MKVYTTDKIRNVVVVGHGGCGKTSLIEMVLYKSGVTTRLGSVDLGTSFCNYDHEEIKRQTSIYLKIIPIEWNGYKINFIDTPGYADFIGEILCGIKASDIGLIVVSAVAGIEVQTQKVWRMLYEKSMPRAFFINKCDREGSDFDSVLNSLKNTFSNKVVPFQIPIEQGQNLKGIIDVLTEKAYVYKDDKFEIKEIPQELNETVKIYKSGIIETSVETDDALLEKYLETGEVSEEELIKALHKAFNSCELFPVFCGASTKAIGAEELLNNVISIFPQPADTQAIKAKDAKGNEVSIRPDSNEQPAGFIFKIISEPQLGEIAIMRFYSGKLTPGTELINIRQNSSERIGHIMVIRGKNRDEITEVYAGDICALPKLKNTYINDTLSSPKRKLLFPEIVFPEPVVDFSIRTASRKDQEKLGNAFSKILANDPTIKLQMDPEFNQTIIKGMGEQHIEITMSKIKERFLVEATLDKPLIPYRETIRTQQEARFRHKKQSGGAGQFAEVALRISPLERGKGFEFVDDIVGGVIPSQFIPSCEKGVIWAMKEGVIAGYPVVDVQVSLWDGKDHPVDSKDIAFQIAARTAFKMAMEAAKPVLLEPIMNVEITVPDKYTGDVTGNLNSRRGRIQGIESLAEFQVIKATVPQAEMYGYSGDLRSMTQGTGSYTMSFSHYEELTGQLAERVITESKKREEETREKE